MRPCTPSRGCILMDITKNQSGDQLFKDVPGGFPKSDLLGVTVALIHVAVVLTPEQYNKVVLCQLQRHLALWL